MAKSKNVLQESPLPPELEGTEPQHEAVPQEAEPIVYKDAVAAPKSKDHADLQAALKTVQRLLPKVIAEDFADIENDTKGAVVRLWDRMHGALLGHGVIA